MLLPSLMTSQMDINVLYRRSYMSNLALLNLSNELRKETNWEACRATSLIRSIIQENECYIDHMTLKLLKITFWRENSRFCHLLHTVIIDVNTLRY